LPVVGAGVGAPSIAGRWSHLDRGDGFAAEADIFHPQDDLGAAPGIGIVAERGGASADYYVGS